MTKEQELQEEIDRLQKVEILLRSRIERQQQQLTRLEEIEQEENARLRKVLAEYANIQNWNIFIELVWNEEVYCYEWVGENDNPVKMAQDVLEENKE